MRIGLDARPALYTRSGIGTYVRELVPALARTFPQDRFEGYAHRLRGRGARRSIPDWPANARLHDRPWPASGVRLLARVGLGAERLLGGVDLLHLTDYVTLPAGRTPFVATIHDVLFASLPECYTPIMRANLDAFTRHALATARQVIVPSERVRHDLRTRFGADSARVHVVAHGTPALPAPAPPFEARPPYVLALGTLEPRKNLPRLLAALDQVRARGHDLTVVVAGARGWLDEETLAALARRPWVDWVGPVGRPRAAALLAGAVALAYPSLGEGFGLPVLEGFAAGVPVLVGAGTACADLAGDAALAADPRDVEALADALCRLVSDPALRAVLVERGRQVAAAYTWERAARLTRAVYERALAS